MRVPAQLVVALTLLSPVLGWAQPEAVEGEGAAAEGSVTEVTSEEPTVDAGDVHPLDSAPSAPPDYGERLPEHERVRAEVEGSRCRDPWQNVGSLPAVRLGVGAGLTPEASFIFEAGLGWQQGLACQLMLWPDVAYTRVAGEEVNSNFFSAGFGPHLTFTDLQLGWQPRFVMGKVDEDSVLGVRNGLVVGLGEGSFNLEVAHQYLDRKDQPHEVLALAYVDPLRITSAFLYPGAD